MKKPFLIVVLLVCLISFSSCFYTKPVDTDIQQPLKPADIDIQQPEKLQPTLKHPVHFEIVNENTYKEDVHNAYGTPEKVEEDGKAESYYLTFLGASGDFQIVYMNNSDKVYLARFLIDSRDFASMDDYEKAVSEAVSHFEETLSHLWKTTSIDEGKTAYAWHNEEAGYSYSIYYTRSYILDENGYWNGEMSDTSIFQFNHYWPLDNE